MWKTQSRCQHLQQRYSDLLQLLHIPMQTSKLGKDGASHKLNWVQESYHFLATVDQSGAGVTDRAKFWKYYSGRATGPFEGISYSWNRWQVIWQTSDVILKPPNLIVKTKQQEVNVYAFIKLPDTLKIPQITRRGSGFLKTLGNCSKENDSTSELLSNNDAEKSPKGVRTSRRSTCKKRFQLQNRSSNQGVTRKLLSSAGEQSLTIRFCLWQRQNQIRAKQAKVNWRLLLAFREGHEILLGNQDQKSGNATCWRRCSCQNVNKPSKSGVSAFLIRHRSQERLLCSQVKKFYGCLLNASPTTISYQRKQNKNPSQKLQ